MAKRLTRVIRRVKPKQAKKASRKRAGGYDVSFRATGYRHMSKTEQNAQHR